LELRMLNKPESQPEKKEAVVIKKYANRRLYNTETSTYVTLDDLAQMVRSDKDFVVYDAKTGDELTHAVLTQIIVEQEGRHGGQNLLPIPFLRQLIRFYDDSIGRLVPSYLQFSLENLVKEQEKFRSLFANAFTNPAAAFEAFSEQTRTNMKMFEQAMSMWTSFGAAAQSKGGAALEPRDNRTEPPRAETGERQELDALKQQLAEMQQKIERLAQGRD
jgi:polyhydroxyalkanoate synthesis repressor PhaR